MSDKMKGNRMKKPIQKPRVDSVDLRRWCVECAIRWPTYANHLHGNFGQASSGLGQMYQPQSPIADHDVIARAEKIMQWVTK